MNMPLQKKCSILFSVVLFEYLMFIFSGTSFTSLTGNEFFSLNADPVLWVFYLAGIPQFILGNLVIAILFDVAIVLLLILVIRNPFSPKVALLLFVLLLLFYATLVGHLAHRNYQVGFFLVFLPFIFKKQLNMIFAFDALRYFLLFFYFSAAVLKIVNSSFADPLHFSNLLAGQFSPYFLEGNTGVRTQLNLYLISHPGVSQAIFFFAFIAEASVAVGFFTKRFDKALALTLLIFHFGTWVMMDIAPFGQLAFICLLFLSNDMDARKSARPAIAEGRR